MLQADNRTSVVSLPLHEDAWNLTARCAVQYLMAQKEHGLEKVHRHVGREPSGQIFNQLTLKHVNVDRVSTSGHLKFFIAHVGSTLG